MIGKVCRWILVEWVFFGGVVGKRKVLLVFCCGVCCVTFVGLSWFAVKFSV